MKNKAIGLWLVIVSSSLLVANIEKFIYTYYTFFYRDEHTRLKDYLVSVAHPLLYLVIVYTGVSLGIQYIKSNEGAHLKNKKIWFVIVMMIWLVLELPVYTCDFYGVRHSFWASQRGHFH
jgi:Na+/melibiose symporter-like transporter